MSRYYVVEVDKPSPESEPAAPAVAAWQDWMPPNHCTVTAHTPGALTFTLVLPADDPAQAAREAQVIVGEGSAVLSVRAVTCAPSPTGRRPAARKARTSQLASSASA